MLTHIPSVASFMYHGRQAVAHPRVQAFLRALRAQQTLPDAKLGVAGFCWGGLHAVLLTHDGPQNKYSPSGGGEERPLVDCSFTAHPSMLSFPKHIEDVVGPLSVANGDDDRYMGKEKMQTLVKILEGKNAAAGETPGGAKYEVVVYPGARHGFGVRADPKDPVQREAEKGSEAQAVKWFKRWFGAEQS
jgi:dienelactone hydrolase